MAAKRWGLVATAILLAGMSGWALAAGAPGLVFPGGSVELQGGDGNLSTPLRLLVMKSGRALSPSRLLMLAGAEATARTSTGRITVF